MAIQQMTIMYLGKPEIIHIEDDISLGELEKAFSNSVTTDVIQMKMEDSGKMSFEIDLSKMNIMRYRRDMAHACIKKAPWIQSDMDPVDLDTIFKGVGHKVGNQVINKVMEIYPPFSFLLDLFNSMVGGEDKEPVKKKSKKLKVSHT